MPFDHVCLLKSTKYVISKKWYGTEFFFIMCCCLPLLVCIINRKGSFSKNKVGKGNKKEQNLLQIFVSEKESSALFRF